MAKRCPACFQDVGLHCGCSVARVVIAGVTYERIRFNAAGGGRCEGCGSVANSYHHHGCAREVCPVCGQRACGCRRQNLRAPPMMLDQVRELEFGKMNEAAAPKRGRG
jgi:hypothetical protein